MSSAGLIGRSAADASAAGSQADVFSASPGQGHPRKWLILVAVSLAMMLGIFNIALVNIAIPALVRDLGSTVDRVSWVLNAFNISQAVLLLSFGRLADRFGARLVFLTSICAFTVFSLACGLSQNVQQLIAFRILQGISAAGVVPVSLVILLRAFPPHQHGLATGMWGSFGQVAAILGAPVGGLLIGYASWHWMFFMNVPLGIAAAVMSFAVVPRGHHQHESTGLDLPGIGLSAAALFCLTLAIIQGNSWGWGSTAVLALFAAFAVSLVVFVAWERRSRSPMLDPRLFHIRAFSTSAGMSIFGGVGMAASALILILFMINVLGWSEARAATVMIPTSCVTLVLSPFAGRLVDRVGPRFLGASGALLMATGFTLFATLRADATASSIIWRAMFVGLAMAVNMPAIMAAGLTSLPPRSTGVGSGMISTAQQIGNVVGLALLLAVCGHAALAGTAATVTEASAYVVAREDVSPALKDEIIRLIEFNADKDGAAKAAVGGFFDPAAGLAEALAGKAEATVVESLQTDISAVAKDQSGRVYKWPFLVGAIFTFLNLPLAFMLGRRLGSQQAGADDDACADVLGMDNATTKDSTT